MDRSQQLGPMRGTRGPTSLFEDYVTLSKNKQRLSCFYLQLNVLTDRPPCVFVLTTPPSKRTPQLAMAVRITSESPPARPEISDPHVGGQF